MTKSEDKKAKRAAERLKRIREPYVEELNDLADRIRKEVQKKHPDAIVPYFDPDCGGVSARILFLLQRPGSQIVNFDFDFMECNPDDPSDPDINDKTAKNMLPRLKKAGISREELCYWNVVPFFIPSERQSSVKAHNIKPGEYEESKPWIIELLSLLPKLEVVVLMGRKAQKSKPLIEEKAKTHPIRVLETWHPSNQGLNSEARRAEFSNTLEECRTLLDRKI